MAKEKNKKTTSASKAVGAAMVALSGFVPVPSMQVPGISGNLFGGSARAAKLSIPMNGSALSGVAMAGPSALKFGIVVATAKTGTFGVKTDNGTTGVAGAKKLSGQAAGAIGTYTILATGKVDVTVSKIGKITLTGAGATGAVKLDTINFGVNLGGAALKVGAVGTKAVKAAYVITTTKAAASAKIGGTLKWAGQATPPVGTIPAATAMVITVSF
jgi:hypothetical protein